MTPRSTRARIERSLVFLVCLLFCAGFWVLVFIAMGGL